MPVFANSVQYPQQSKHFYCRVFDCDTRR